MSQHLHTAHATRRSKAWTAEHFPARTQGLHDPVRHAGDGAQMPRRRSPPRLYLDPGRKTWVIRDGASFIRLGVGEHDRERAENQLAEYLGAQWDPARGPDPLIADLLSIYAREHLAHVATARNSAYSLGYLLRWWDTRRASEITPANCRAYATAATSTATARKDLELLKAAIQHY